ncbi:hypothetical protein BC828DRAFT_127959 [Blastocladiella britannica]|nr:hypothetical protein BC828DRAFT_127959 [Blastocladiella britannica]
MSSSCAFPSFGVANTPPTALVVPPRPDDCAKIGATCVDPTVSLTQFKLEGCLVYFRPTNLAVPAMWTCSDFTGSQAVKGASESPRPLGLERVPYVMTGDNGQLPALAQGSNQRAIDVCAAGTNYGCPAGWTSATTPLFFGRGSLKPTALIHGCLWSPGTKGSEPIACSWLNLEVSNNHTYWSPSLVNSATACLPPASSGTPVNLTHVDPFVAADAWAKHNQEATGGAISTTVPPTSPLAPVPSAAPTATGAQANNDTSGGSLSIPMVVGLGLGIGIIIAVLGVMGYFRLRQSRHKAMRAARKAQERQDRKSGGGRQGSTRSSPNGSEKPSRSSSRGASPGGGAISAGARTSHPSRSASAQQQQQHSSYQSTRHAVSLDPPGSSSSSYSGRRAATAAAEVAADLDHRKPLPLPLPPLESTSPSLFRTPTPVHQGGVDVRVPTPPPHMQHAFAMQARTPQPPVAPVDAAFAPVDIAPIDVGPITTAPEPSEISLTSTTGPNGTLESVLAMYSTYSIGGGGASDLSVTSSPAAPASTSAGAGGAIGMVAGARQSQIDAIDAAVAVAVLRAAAAAALQNTDMAAAAAEATLAGASAPSEGAIDEDPRPRLPNHLAYALPASIPVAPIYVPDDSLQSLSDAWQARFMAFESEATTAATQTAADLEAARAAQCAYMAVAISDLTTRPGPGSPASAQLAADVQVLAGRLAGLIPEAALVVAGTGAAVGLDHGSMRVYGAGSAGGSGGDSGGNGVTVRATVWPGWVDSRTGTVVLKMVVVVE